MTPCKLVVNERLKIGEGFINAQVQLKTIHYLLLAIAYFNVTK